MSSGDYGDRSGRMHSSNGNWDKGHSWKTDESRQCIGLRRENQKSLTQQKDWAVMYQMKACRKGEENCYRVVVRRLEATVRWILTWCETHPHQSWGEIFWEKDFYDRLDPDLEHSQRNIQSITLNASNKARSKEWKYSFLQCGSLDDLAQCRNL